MRIPMSTSGQCQCPRRCHQIRANPLCRVRAEGWTKPSSKHQHTSATCEHSPITTLPATILPVIVRGICKDGTGLFTCLWLISRSELLLFTLWLLLLLWYREYTLGCVHLKRDCLELGHGSPAIYCSETHVGNAGTAWSRVQWILSNAGHEPELQSYTAGVSLLSLSPSLYAELPLWFWVGGSSAEC